MFNCRVKNKDININVLDNFLLEGINKIEIDLGFSLKKVLIIVSYSIYSL